MKQKKDFSMKTIKQPKNTVVVEADDSETISLSDEQKKEIEAKLRAISEKDPELKKRMEGGTLKKLCSAVYKMIGSMAFSMMYSRLDKLSFGNLTDAVKDIITTDEINGKESDLTNMSNELVEKYPEIRTAQEQEKKEKKADSREDENTSTEIDTDPKHFKFDCIFSGDDGKELIKIIEQIKTECKETTKNVEKADKDADAKIAKLKLNLDKKTIETYTPQIYAMIQNGKNKDEIEKEINKLKDAVEESLSVYTTEINSKNILVEHKKILTEEQKDIYTKFIAFEKSKNMLLEWSIMNLFPSSSSISQSKFDTVINATTNVGYAHRKGDHTLFDTTYQDIFDTNITTEINGQKVTQTALKGTSALTAWLPILVAGAMAITYKFRKQIRNAIQRSYQKMLNSGGGIATMDFQTTNSDKKNKYKYTLQFSVKDFKWRVLNRKNILHYPSKELLKAALDGELGKRFRQWCNERWSPIFEPANPGEVAGFASLINYSKDDSILDKKQKKMITDFGKNWERIKKDCLSDDYKFDIRPRGGSVVSNS